MSVNKLRRTVENAIDQMSSVDKFITCLMLANGICFWGRTPKHYKSEETIRRKCPPKVRQIFNLRNLKRLGVVFPVPKQANLVALEGYGIRVGQELYESGEAEEVYELYGMEYVPLSL